MSFGAARRWVYTHTVEGRFQRVHRVSGALLQAVFLVVPWLHWEGHPLARIDLPGRRLTLLGSTFTAEDTLFLVLLLLMAVFGVFLVTTVLGRVWCGWACPQTVFLEEWIRPIEHLVEGERGARIRRDKGPWTAEKVVRKAIKHALYGVAAIGVGFSFASWFNAPLLLWSGRAGVGAEAFAIVLSVAMYVDFAWFREQFCAYLCPYARFQGALTDPQSLVIGYDVERGEPRRGPGVPASDAGACSNCRMCVVVCPAGIDIRDGYQLECISCARCVDACEDAQSKHAAPTLVRYAPMARGSLLRPRVVVYAGLLTLAAAAFVAAGMSHRAVQLDVNRAPGTLYVVDPDDFVRNTFLVRIANNEVEGGEGPYRVEVAGLPDTAQVTAIPATVPPSSSVTVPLVVRVPRDHGVRTLPFTVTLRGADDAHTAHVDTTFKGE